MGQTHIEEKTLVEAHQAAMDALHRVMDDEKFLIAEDDNGNMWLFIKKDGVLSLNKVSNHIGAKVGIYDTLDKLNHTETDEDI